MASSTLTRRFDAVIFDLFGTLVPEFPKREFYGAVREAAWCLGCDPGMFEEEWTITAIARQTGRYETGMRGNVMDICLRLGVPEPTLDEIESALATRAELYVRWFVPRPGALEAVHALRDRGIPLALISMCAPDTPEIWRASPFAGLFDVEVFSSEVALRKPDPAIYRYATDRLGVDATHCLYCGDGAYAELTGAESLGMTAVMIDDLELDHGEMLRPEGEDWAGARVADLRKLLDLV